MLRRPRIFASLAFALGLALAAAHAHAATVLALDLAGLVRASDYVVLAHATAERSRYRDDLIVTDVTLRVAQSLRGDIKAGGTLTATHLGGSVGDIGLSVPGEATFAIGQSAVVFLRRTPQSNDLSVVGMSQGVLPIVGDKGDERVLPSGHDAELVTRNADGKLVTTQGALQQARPLRELLAELTRLISQHHAR
jgi:hypothetical protein